MTYRPNTKVGVYVDVANMYFNGGRRMQYDALREFACRDGADPLRLNAYVSFDVERAQEDIIYRDGINKFHAKLQDFGYKVIRKEVKWYQDDDKRYRKANADLDLAVDVLLQSKNLDRILIATGDGDFVRVVRALQNLGCRVEIVAMDNVSSDLRHEADMFMSGYLIPNLIPIDYHPDNMAWGDVGSRVRGVCYRHGDRGYGFMRYLKKIDAGLWLTDTRRSSSPYGSVYFHDSSLLTRNFNFSSSTSQSYVFEFDLVESNRTEELEAVNIKPISKL
ncbi:NYN domain-containing protein [Anaerolineales bacterium HSG24]|nr:NYN domain-containing protein [Anaerolineales bacterium HSG24]